MLTTVSVNVFGYLGVGKDRVINAIRIGNGDITFTDDKENVEIKINLVNKCWSNPGYCDAGYRIENNGVIGKEMVYNMAIKNVATFCINAYNKLGKLGKLGEWGDKYDLARRWLAEYYDKPNNWTDKMHQVIDPIIHKIINLYETNKEVYDASTEPLYPDNIKVLAKKYFFVTNYTKYNDITLIDKDDFLNTYEETKNSRVPEIEFSLKPTGAWMSNHFKILMLSQGGGLNHLQLHGKAWADAKIFIFVISALSNRAVSDTLSYYEHIDIFDPKEVIVFISKTEMATDYQISNCKAAIETYFKDDAGKSDNDKVFRNIKNRYVVTAADLGPHEYPVLPKDKIHQNVAHHLLNCLNKALNPSNLDTIPPPPPQDNLDSSGNPKTGVLTKFWNGLKRLGSRFGTRSQTPQPGGRRRTIKRKKNRRSKKSRNGK